VKQLTFEIKLVESNILRGKGKLYFSLTIYKCLSAHSLRFVFASSKLNHNGSKKFVFIHFFIYFASIKVNISEF